MYHSFPVRQYTPEYSALQAEIDDLSSQIKDLNETDLTGDAHRRSIRAKIKSLTEQRSKKIAQREALPVPKYSATWLREEMIFQAQQAIEDYKGAVEQIFQSAIEKGFSYIMKWKMEDVVRMEVKADIMRNFLSATSDINLCGMVNMYNHFLDNLKSEVSREAMNLSFSTNQVGNFIDRISLSTKAAFCGDSFLRMTSVFEEAVKIVERGEFYDDEPDHLKYWRHERK